MAASSANRFSRPRGRPDEVCLILADLGHLYSVMKLVEGKNITTRDGLLAELRKEVYRIRSDLGLGPWREDYDRNHCGGTENNTERTMASGFNERLPIGAVRVDVATTPTKVSNVDEGTEASEGGLLTHPNTAAFTEDTTSLDKSGKVSVENAASGSLQMRRMHNVCQLDLGELPLLEHARCGGLGRK